MNTHNNPTQIAQCLPLANLNPISESLFKKNFGFMPNDLDVEESNFSFHANLLDHHDPKHLQHVKRVLKSDPRCIWTLMDINNDDVLVSGYHVAKKEGYCRLGHIISDKPLNDDVEMYLVMSRKVF